MQKPWKRHFEAFSKLPSQFADAGRGIESEKGRCASQLRQGGTPQG